MKVNLNNKSIRALMLIPSSIIMTLIVIFSAMFGPKIELMLLYCFFCTITITNSTILMLHDIKQNKK